MKITWDTEAKALYIPLVETENREVTESREVAPGVVIDYRKDGKAIGIEVLNVEIALIRGKEVRSSKSAPEYPPATPKHQRTNTVTGWE